MSARGRVNPALVAACAVACGIACVALPARAAARHAGPPKATEMSYFYDLLDQAIARPITRAADPALGVRELTRHPREAVNADADDQVRLPSTWWQPRVGFRTVTPEQLAHGPGPGTGPAPGPFTITKAKSQGVTPGFYITDANGDKFIVKFDPPGLEELGSGADVVASVLLWGAGYNVPDDAVFHFRREDARIGDKVQYTPAHGRKHAMQPSDLDAMLSHVALGPDGRYRALASRLIAGKPLGPFRYEGRRKDDPEDLIPHEHRRELRGLWVLAAWLSHTDVRAPNTLDMWETAGDRSFVRHYLIDFNGALGAGSIGEKSLQSGTEYFVDWGVMAKHVPLGLVPFQWEAFKDPELRCLGRFDIATFDPDGWRPDYPNPAFDQRTLRDVRWGARIVAGFDDDLIRAAVARAEFSDPRCSADLAQVLIGRRDKIVHRWLDGMPRRTAAR